MAHSETHHGRQINCIHCGYDLRAADPYGKCPECGADVSDTLNQLSKNSANSTLALCLALAVFCGIVWAIVATASTLTLDGRLPVSPTLLAKSFCPLIGVCAVGALIAFPLTHMILERRDIQKASQILLMCMMIEILAITPFAPSAGLLGMPIAYAIELVIVRKKLKQWRDA